MKSCVHIVTAGLVLVLSSTIFADQPKQGTVKTTDGLNIVYESRGQGDTALVLLHGWCCDFEYWKHQVGEFAKDYRVVTVDLPGHGKSGKDRKQWSIKGLGADVETLIKSLGLKRVILVGHSMGGSIALETSKRMPGVVVGVVGVDTLQNAEFKWTEERAKQILTGFQNDFKATMEGGINGMLPEKTDPELKKWIITRAQAQDQKMALALFEDFPNLDMKQMLKDAKVPIRCINAVPSTPFAQPTAVDINKKYADFNAVMMEGVGHYPMLEKPAEFNQKLREVLKEFM